MKIRQRKLIYFTFLFAGLFLAFQACSSDDDSSSGSSDDQDDDQDDPIAANVVADENFNFFGEISVGDTSEVQSITIKGKNISSAIDLTVDGDFQVSLDNSDFGEIAQIPADKSTDENSVYVRFIPTETGSRSSLLQIKNTETDNFSKDLTGKGKVETYNFQTFDNQRLAFGEGHEQGVAKTFMLQEEMGNIERINMYVQLDCPSGGCNEWDVFAHIQVKDPDSGEWYEMGRYITPYGVDNSQLNRGFKFNVTDFKSLLSGSTELRAYTEVWGSDGWNVSVDFDYIEGTPDYKYYNIARVIEYDKNSLEGVPYGVEHDFDLTKNVNVPQNAEETHLRTIITGWGHATPADAGNRRCAEWCYRTHQVKINGADRFDHEMGPIGCAQNPVSPQGGNWQPDRAGWCPGMAAPIRIDTFDSPMAGQSFAYEYFFEPWEADPGSTGQDGAYYAISSFVVVKSDQPINKPNVSN